VSVADLVFMTSVFIPSSRFAAHLILFAILPRTFLSTFTSTLYQKTSLNINKNELCVQVYSRPHDAGYMLDHISLLSAYERGVQ